MTDRPLSAMPCRPVPAGPVRGGLGPNEVRHEVVALMLDDLAARWREQAEGYARDGATGQAAVLRRVADELEEGRRAWCEAELSLAEAAEESGYSTDRLRELVAEGRLPAAGASGALRVRRADLPRRPRRPSLGVVEDLAERVEAGRR